MGLEGFTGNESILYHLHSPCRVVKLGGFEEIEREEWVPDQHAHRHFTTFDVEPEGDEVTGRRLLMWNDDVEISLCRPTERMHYFFRNGEGDEVVFVHEGTGVLETIFGESRTRTATTSSSARRRTGSARGPAALSVQRRGSSRSRRYRNQYGQILEGAPYYPAAPPPRSCTVRETGEFHQGRVRGGYQTYVIDTTR
jgi:homogentisate 1,2-dioxygenase